MKITDILLLCGLFLIIIIIYVGILHFFWWLTVRKEKKPHQVYKTTNGKKPFHFTAERSGHGLLHAWVEGSLEGPTPARNDVAYLTDGGRTRPVLLIGVRPLDQTKVSDLTRVRLRLFGVGRLISADAAVTSLRPEEPAKRMEYTDVPAKEKFPLVGRRKLTNLPVGIAAAGLGFFMAVILIVSMVKHVKMSEGALLACILSGGFLLFIGGWMLLDIICFRVIMRQDYTMEVRTIFTRHQYHLYNLGWTINAPDPKTEKRRLTLWDAGKRNIAVLEEGSRDFYDICCWVTEVARWERREKLWRSLLEAELYVAIDRGEAPDDEGKLLLIQNKEGRRGVPAYRSEEDLRKDCPEEKFGMAVTTLEHLVELTEGFTLADDIVIFSEDGETDIGRDEWKKITALKDLPVGTPLDGE